MTAARFGVQPVYVHCGACAHAWPLFHAPIDIAALAVLRGTCCPVCRSATVYMGLGPRAGAPQ